MKISVTSESACHAVLSILSKYIKNYLIHISKLKKSLPTALMKCFVKN